MKGEGKRRGNSKRSRKRMQAKNIGKSPVWLKTVAISKRGWGPKITGTFGAASEVRQIDPSEYKIEDDGSR